MTVRWMMTRMKVRFKKKKKKALKENEMRSGLFDYASIMSVSNCAALSISY